MANQIADAPGGKYLPIPAEIGRKEILKVPPVELHKWFKMYGPIALNRRLQGQD